MKQRGWLSLIGFILFFVGFMSLIFAIVGLNFSFLRPLNSLSGGLSLLIKLSMMFGGVIILYVSKSDNRIH